MLRSRGPITAARAFLIWAVFAGAADLDNSQLSVVGITQGSATEGPRATSNSYDVQATFPPGSKELLVTLPVWTPGSYLVRVPTYWRDRVQGASGSTPRPHR
jgi:hypothetical protein